MNPNTKRYLPLVLLVGVGAAGVYFTQGNRLAGEAMGGGCGGGGEVGSGPAVHTETDTNALGEVDEAVFAQLDELTKLRFVPGTRPDARNAQAAERLIAAIEGRGPPALASVATHFRDNGCGQPGSAIEANLLLTVSSLPGVDAAKRQIISDIFLDAAIHEATRIRRFEPEDPTDAPVYSKRPEIVALVDALKKGEAATLPAVVDKAPSQDEVTWDCTQRSIAGAQRLLALGVADPTSLFDRSVAAVETLDPRHEATYALIDLASDYGRVIKTPAGKFTQFTALSTLGPRARAAACRAAIDLGAGVAELREKLGTDTPRSLLRCLDSVSAAPADANDADLRASAARRQTYEKSGDAVRQALTEAFEGGSSERPMTLREQAARFEAVSRVVAGSDDGEAMLAPLNSIDLTERQKVLLSEGLARALLRNNSRKLQVVPQLTRAAGEAPTASQRFAGFARGEGELKVSPNVFGADALTQPQPGDGPHDGAKLAERRLTDGFCDAVVEAGNADKVIAVVTRTFGRNTIVCARPGIYEGPLEMNVPGVRLIALAPEVVLRGGLLLGAPTVVVGLVVEGPVVIAPSAAGSVLTLSRFSEGGHSATSDIMLARNTIGEGKQFRLPVGDVDVVEWVPAVAEALRVLLQIDPAADKPSNDLRWVGTQDLRPYRPLPKFEAGPQPTWPGDAQDGLRVAKGEKPLIGEITKGGPQAGLLVPLTSSPWNRQVPGFIVRR